MSPFTFCVFAVKDDSHQSSMNAKLRGNTRRITGVRASRKAKGQKPRTGILTMQICDVRKSLRIAAVAVVSIIIGVPTLVSAQAQAKPSTAPAAPPVQLQPYSAQDQSASAGVPSGWKVTGAVGGSINMSGPQGETINFGDVFLAHNGPFQLGQKGPSPAMMSMPSSAKLSDKFVMFLQQQESVNGSPNAQVKFTYAAPLQSLPAGVQCGVFVVAISGIATPVDGMGLFCSLPPDTAQLFKVVLLIGSAPSAMAAQTVPTVAAVFKSYMIAPGWVQKMLSPYTPPASGSSSQGGASPAEVQMYLKAMASQQAVIDHGFTCANAGILGNGSNFETPRECGGWAPNF
jgi:hypothetical protein